jgi:hypothetical protein
MAFGIPTLLYGKQPMLPAGIIGSAGSVSRPRFDLDTRMSLSVHIAGRCRFILDWSGFHAGPDSPSWSPVPRGRPGGDRTEPHGGIESAPSGSGSLSAPRVGTSPGPRAARGARDRSERCSGTRRTVRVSTSATGTRAARRCPAPSSSTLRASAPSTGPSARCDVDDREETVGRKTRAAEQDRVPYVVVAGEREASGGALSVRMRVGRETRTMNRPALASCLRAAQGGLPFRPLPTRVLVRENPVFYG